MEACLRGLSGQSQACIMPSCLPSILFLHPLQLRNPLKLDNFTQKYKY